MIAMKIKQGIYSMSDWTRSILGLRVKCKDVDADMDDGRRSMRVDNPDVSCTISCFVTVSDDFGYGFALYDPYGLGERKLR